MRVESAEKTVMFLIEMEDAPFEFYHRLGPGHWAAMMGESMETLHWDKDIAPLEHAFQQWLRYTGETDG